jgi:hypothetical protein
VSEGATHWLLPSGCIAALPLHRHISFTNNIEKIETMLPANQFCAWSELDVNFLNELVRLG